MFRWHIWGIPYLDVGLQEPPCGLHSPLHMPMASSPVGPHRLGWCWPHRWCWSGTGSAGLAGSLLHARLGHLRSPSTRVFITLDLVFFSSLPPSLCNSFFIHQLLFYTSSSGLNLHKNWSNKVNVNSMLTWLCLQKSFFFLSNVLFTQFFGFFFALFLRGLIFNINQILFHPIIVL